ncbi:hypothetical protein NIB75_00395 [Bacteroides uniformis]|nr:hypothetical protein [Bacteroides uniformis]
MLGHGPCTAIPTCITQRKTIRYGRCRRSSLTWQIAHDGTTVLQPSAIALQGRDEKSAKKAITFGKNVKVIRAERKSVESSFPTPLYKKSKCEGCLQPADTEMPRRLQRTVPRIR